MATTLHDDAPADAARNGRPRPRPTALPFTVRGTTCAASLFLPARGGVAPCVVLGHGFNGVRSQLEAHAARFAAAGLAALTFDYRGFGGSDGEPRQRVSGHAQLEDWRGAVALARSLSAVDADRVALWGTSSSGGHVVRLAAEDPRVAAAVVQMPLVSGRAQLGTTPLPQSLRLLGAGLVDVVRATLGAAPLTLPQVGRPGSLAFVTSPDALSGLHAIVEPGSTWRNEVLARSALGLAFAEPGRAARRVRRPLLVCVADGDLVVPAAPALRLARKAPHGRLARYPYGHFAMYVGEAFERVVADQIAFLAEHLEAGGPS
jgi:hypothetical protein